jgi:hypothetical protein
MSPIFSRATTTMDEGYIFYSRMLGIPLPFEVLWDDDNDADATHSDVFELVPILGNSFGRNLRMKLEKCAIKMFKISDNMTF